MLRDMQTSRFKPNLAG